MSPGRETLQRSQVVFETSRRSSNVYYFFVLDDRSETLAERLVFQTDPTNSTSSGAFVSFFKTVASELSCDPRFFLWEHPKFAEHMPID